MISLWHQGRFYDSFYNTLNDQYFMEITLVNLGFDPLECQWIEYETNPNGHNPKKIEDSDKSFEWISSKFVPVAIVTESTVTETSKNYYTHQVYKMLSRIINKQNEILGKYLLPIQNAPEIPTEIIAKNVVENKVVMEQMKKMVPKETDYVFKEGRRLKKYFNEDKNLILPKLRNLKDVAHFLLNTKTVWSTEFKNKLLALNK